MNLNIIINDIVSRVDKRWSTLEQARFAYVELGKYLQKNTDFFFSVDNKLQHNNLSFEEIENIYNGESTLSTEIICKSASQLLKAILDRLGIESKLVKSINNVIPYSEGDKSIDINHWFLAIKDSDGVYFFATLSSDLPYIQMGMETKHFGSNIGYKKELSDGTVQQVYEGEEIKNKVISKETLRDVDIKIKYMREYYMYDDQARPSKEWNLHYSNASFYMLRDAIKANKLYYELLVSETDFLNDAFSFKGSNGEEISLYDRDFSSLSNEDKLIWLKNICKNVLNKICDIIGYEVVPIPPVESRYWNYEAWLFSLSYMIEDDIYKRFEVKNKSDIYGVGIDVTNFNYSRWSKKVKNTFSFRKEYEYENIIIMLDKLNALVNCVLGNNKNSNLRSLFNSLCTHFVDGKDLYINNISEDGRLSNEFIANKFSIMFKRVFGCNEEVTSFNNMSYSEQVVIIKEILPLILPDITYENSKMIKGYDNRFSPVLNRVHIFPIKHNETGEYAIVFGILGDTDLEENDFYYFYDLKTNTFKICDILAVYLNYTIVSNRMKNKFSVEDLEYLETQRKK